MDEEPSLDEIRRQEAVETLNDTLREAAAAHQRQTGRAADGIDEISYVIDNMDDGGLRASLQKATDAVTEGINQNTENMEQVVNNLDFVRELLLGEHDEELMGEGEKPESIEEVEESQSRGLSG